MENILLTGSSGFIGKHLFEKIDLLKNDYRLIGLSSSLKNKNHVNYDPLQNFKSLFLDLEINEFDIVIHCGAFTPKNREQVDSFDNNFNVISTVNLLKSLPNIPKSFVFISTLDVYENTNGIISETSNVKPNNLYSLSKFYCEELIIKWGKENNVIVHILRVGHIYGPGEEKYQKLIPTIMDNVINDISPSIYNLGKDLRSFLYIDDCIQAIINALKLNKSHGIINIVSGKPYSVNYITETIVKISGKDLKTKLLNVDGIIKRDWIFDNSKMSKLLHEEITDIIDGLNTEFKYLINGGA